MRSRIAIAGKPGASDLGQPSADQLARIVEHRRTPRHRFASSIAATMGSDDARLRATQSSARPRTVPDAPQAPVRAPPSSPRRSTRFPSSPGLRGFRRSVRTGSEIDCNRRNLSLFSSSTGGMRQHSRHRDRRRVVALDDPGADPCLLPQFEVAGINWEGSARLDPDRSPSDVPVKRWQRFVDDVGLFLDSPFCAVAATLGRGPHDLFGCDRDRPYAMIASPGRCCTSPQIVIRESAQRRPHSGEITVAITRTSPASDQRSRSACAGRSAVYRCGTRSSRCSRTAQPAGCR